MIVVVAALKGGVGKTTTSVYLAALAAAAKREVTLVDADPQASAADWVESAEDDPLTRVSLVEAPTDRLLTKALDRVEADEVARRRHASRQRAAAGQGHRPGRQHRRADEGRWGRDPAGRGGARAGAAERAGRARDLLGPHLHPRLPGCGRRVGPGRCPRVGQRVRARRHRQRPRRLALAPTGSTPTAGSGAAPPPPPAADRTEAAEQSEAARAVWPGSAKPARRIIDGQS